MDNRTEHGIGNISCGEPWSATFWRETTQRRSFCCISNSLWTDRIKISHLYPLWPNIQRWKWKPLTKKNCVSFCGHRITLYRIFGLYLIIRSVRKESAEEIFETQKHGLRDERCRIILHRLSINISFADVLLDQNFVDTVLILSSSRPRVNYEKINRFLLKDALQKSRQRHIIFQSVETILIFTKLFLWLTLLKQKRCWSNIKSYFPK